MGSRFQIKFHLSSSSSEKSLMFRRFGKSGSSEVTGPTKVVLISCTVARHESKICRSWNNSSQFTSARTGKQKKSKCAGSLFWT